MNLYGMLRRQDRNIIAEGEVTLAEDLINGETWRGARLSSGASIRIVDARRFSSLRGWPQHCGWMARIPRKMALEVKFVTTGTDEILGQCVVSDPLQTLRLPWPRIVSGATDLLLAAHGKGKDAVFLANHKALSRQWLIDAAKGTGIEIGPGSQPQILPTPNVRINYLEQVSPEDWNRLYNRGGKYPFATESWDNYILGEASELPVADQSQDFIFASHVFEHLVNPLGHLRHWQRKLKPGGKIICIIPDLAGTADALQQPSTMAEWIREDRRELWQPVRTHYARHMRCPPDDTRVAAAIKQRQSIHAHYYDNLNCQLLLDYAVKEIGYADYVIEHTPNHKDFHFILFNR